VLRKINLVLQKTDLVLRKINLVLHNTDLLPLTIYLVLHNTDLVLRKVDPVLQIFLHLIKTTWSTPRAIFIAAKTIKTSDV
jgi:hypothetical protein